MVLSIQRSIPRLFDNLEKQVGGHMAEFVTIKNLHKNFIKDSVEIKVLNGVNLTVNKGEIFGVIGFSGAGKSTLARCINRLETPDSGEIYVDGTQILALSENELRKKRKKIGMIFQNFNLFESKTVYQNIAYPLVIDGYKKSDIKKKVLETAEMVGLTDKLSEYPGALSGGQKQRVGIARALVGDPELLLSDESTSALDPQTTIQILDLLKEINRKKNITILMITHELDAIKYTCKKMAVLENGEITEEGLVEDIFKSPTSKTGALFAKVFNQMQHAELGDGAGI